MSLIRSVKSNYRYAAGLRRFLRRPVDIKEARARIERRLARRGEAFLELLELAVYSNPKKHAGFSLTDVRQLVDEVGLEGALGRLYDAGVYVTQDEMKGRRPTSTAGSKSRWFAPRRAARPASRRG